MLNKRNWNYVIVAFCSCFFSSSSIEKQNKEFCSKKTIHTQTFRQFSCWGNTIQMENDRAIECIIYIYIVYVHIVKSTCRIQYSEKKKKKKKKVGKDVFSCDDDSSPMCSKRRSREHSVLFYIYIYLLCG